MKFKVILLFVLGFFICTSLTWSHPPKRVTGDDDERTDTVKRKNNPDSIRQAREHATDSIRAERQHMFDSIQIARRHITDSMTAMRKYRESKHYKDSVALSRKQKTASKTGTQTGSDSLKNVRKHVMDSTAAVRKYKESKRYKDSVEKSRLTKANKLKKARQSSMDSLKDVRKHITDSIASSRKTITDSIKTIQKHRTDSLARKKKYKESKRYADSVTIVKRERSDSIKSAQKATRDRMAATRKKSLDSANTIRKHSMDSLKAVRTKTMDSVKMVRKKKVDSLAKVKSDKEKLAKAKEKKKETDLKLKMELKIKQKHEAWSNKSMLKKRWGPIRRLTQNSFTHYNYYFNAKRKMEEAMENMQRTRKENYDSVIGLYSFDPNRDSTLLSADMDSIVRKVSVGIQIHDPRVKWSNDLYLLLGQAYYYRGNYENASIAFRYIISADEAKKKAEAKKNGYSRSKEAPSFVEGKKKGFLGHKSVHNEAILWLARTYTAANQAENAESVLSLLAGEAKLPNDLKGKLATEKAFAQLREGNFDAAAEQLAITEDDATQPDWLRVRAAFIHGQLLQNMGKYAEAAASFEKVLTYYPKIEMDFYARKYIAYNKLMAGQNIADAMRPLKNVINDGKYVNYYDQVYYVLGTIAAKGNENEEAIKYLNKSVTTPKATKKQKALSYAALGDVYYTETKYTAAKNAYDSAAKYGSAKDANIAVAMQKSKGLEEIAGPLKVIHDQDSLLELSKHSKKEQQNAVKRALRAMEQKQQDSIIAAESSGISAAAPEPVDAADPSAASWYFGNPSLMQQGNSDFKRKWGNRPLTDNWRRAAGSAIASSNNSNGKPADDDEIETTTASAATGMPTEDNLLAKIPNTQQQKDLAAKVQQRAYILLAKGYTKLENYDEAIHTLDTLDSRYPSHNQKEEALYLRYRIALKQNKLDKAQAYAQQFLAQFPSSQYAGLLRPKQSESKGGAATNQPVAVYYDETYDLMMNHQYTEVLMHINVARKQYDHPTFLKRFDIAEASTYAGMGDYDKADTLLVKFIKAHPSDSLTAWAKEVQLYVKEMRAGGKPSWYKETPPGSEPVVKDKPKPVEEPKKPEDIKPKEPEIPSIYGYNPDREHYCIIVIPGIDSRTLPLKQGIRDQIAAKYASSELNLLLDMYGIDQGVLVIKKFMNANFAQAYLNDLMSSLLLKGYAPGEIQVMTISADNYRKLFHDKDVAPYTSFYKAKY